LHYFVNYPKVTNESIGNGRKTSNEQFATRIKSLKKSVWPLQFHSSNTDLQPCRASALIPTETDPRNRIKRELVASLVEKCFASARTNTRKLANDLVLMLVEVDNADGVTVRIPTFEI
jgi:hypothetical protein